MGTRNLTVVIDQEGQTKIAQYGQWDGYPEGQGTTILNFISNPENLAGLKNALLRVRFLDIEGRDKEFVNDFNKANPLSEEQERWYNLYKSRDIGGEILNNVTSSKDEEVILFNEISFGKDGIMCEWIYTINFQTNKFIVHSNFNHPPLKEYDLDNLPSLEVFLKDLNGEEEDE